MIEHTINREIFDFHYGSEKVAEKMQKQLVNYYAYEFNQVIQRAIEQQFTQGEFYFCDKIEIDLGDIDEDAFEERNVFEKFEEALTQKLLQVKSSPSAKVSYEQMAEEVVRQFLLKGDVPWWINKNNGVIAIQPLARLLMNRAPEKLMAIVAENTEVTLARLTKLFNESRSDDITEFKSFLEILRKEIPSTEQISFAAKATSDLHSNRHEKATLIKRDRVTLQLDELEPDVLQKLEKILSTDISSHFSTDKEGIIAAVIKRKRLLPAIRQMALFANQETIKAITRLLQKQRLSAGADEKLKMHLSTFSVYALHWLYAETLRMQSSPAIYHDEENAAFNDQSQLTSKVIENEALNKITPQLKIDESTAAKHLNKEVPLPKDKQQAEPAAEQKSPQKADTSIADTYDREASITYLLEKLRLKKISATIFDNYSDQQIQELVSSFNKIEKDASDKKILATFLLEHPYFFKFNFLKIIIEGFANSPREQRSELSQRKVEESTSPMKAEKPGHAKNINALLSELETLHRKVEAVLQKLSENELLTLKDVLQKGSVATKSERQAILRVLQQVPAKLLVLLQAFTMLSESSIANILVTPPNTKEETIDIIREHVSADHLQHPAGQKKIQINNAGICLVAAYLPAFFKNMHLLEEKKFKSISHAMQAMYLIAYLAEGATKHKEYLLQFNKVLTGFAVTDPVAHMPRLPSGYRKEADALLHAIIENWKALRNTSINGLRQSFLQRNGLLTDNGHSWTLQVERKGHDILIDSVPWGFSMIRFPWMQKPVVVEW